MSILKTAIIAAALTVAASTSSAAILKYDGLAGRGNVSVNSVPSGTLAYSGVAGAFKMRDVGNVLGLGESFIAFCLDLAGTIRTDQEYLVNNVDPFKMDRTLSAFQRSNVEALFQASYALVDVNNNVDAAAFQLALWEVGYETDETTPVSLTTGTRVGNSSAAIKARADAFLASIGTWDGTRHFKVNFLDADDRARQDLVMATPVPVPAAGLLLIGGLGAFGLAKRRAAKRSA